MEIILNPMEEKQINFKFEIEGIDEKLKARLIFPMKEGLNLVYENDIIDGNVELKIPALKEFYKSIDSSNVTMEVISESRRFPTWHGNVEFKTEAKVKVESMKESTVPVKKSTATVAITEMREVVKEVPEMVEKIPTKQLLKDALK